MFDIIISPPLAAVCPQFAGAAVEARIANSPYSPELWQEIEVFVTDYRSHHTTESIKAMPSIQATRLVYKQCGKDPSRYRPSGEALVRRILKGQALYRINTAVDLINLASIAYGYSIGGFDADAIAGNTLTLDVGQAGEPYEGIGRGALNIEGLPVYRDAHGGIGTPTSDHERTKIHLGTTRLLVLVNGYDGNRAQVEACAAFIGRLLRTYASADEVNISLYGIVSS